MKRYGKGPSNSQNLGRGEVVITLRDDHPGRGEVVLTLRDDHPGRGEVVITLRDDHSKGCS